MNYKETLDYMYTRLPMFQRIGPAAYKADLNNTIALCKLTGNPEKSIKSIHIAGTNGKGSVSHMLASVFQEAGYKTGLFTSPHLTDFRERIRINGNMIPENYVVAFIEKFRMDFEAISPSFFELTAVMAFRYFADEKTDIVVLETGMGGRLDSTNVVIPELSVITNIGLDHTQFLGNTIEKIAFEKAGIIKPGIPVIIGETATASGEVFISRAEQERAPIFFADSNYAIQEIHQAGAIHPSTISWKIKPLNDAKQKEISLNCPLTGEYQNKNIVTVIQALEILSKLGHRINEDTIIKGIANVVKNTGIRGRWQIIRRKPLMICDVGHNEDGIREIVRMIQNTSCKKLHMVFGSVNDKDAGPVLKLLPKDAVYYFCKADIPRGMDAGILKEQANGIGLKGQRYDSVKDAIESALQSANPDDLIFIGGSTFIVADALGWLESRVD
ncbi:MAG: bifunctional folylpolyglutamate synthase/dihydrofolate synthase [Bacteroidetes bacterium]|nr:bifunctional folylpolyglutamate synthase/dihydrofolate synthase [Bacteroidota bacterium]